jgi:hypothetical protein
MRTVSAGHHGLPLPAGVLEVEPVERRLFSQISINWAGKPMMTLDHMLVTSGVRRRRPV